MVGFSLIFNPVWIFPTLKKDSFEEESCMAVWCVADERNYLGLNKWGNAQMLLICFVIFVII